MKWSLRVKRKQSRESRKESGGVRANELSLSLIRQEQRLLFISQNKRDNQLRRLDRHRTRSITKRAPRQLEFCDYRELLGT